jgi:Uma2 family endonuclease
MWPSLPDARARSGVAMTLDEWLARGEEEDGELVVGHLEEEEVPDPVHELAVAWLIACLDRWLGGDGFVFGSELRLVLSAQGGRKADVVVVLPGSKPPPRRGPLRRPPDIVVEVVTPTPRDERRDRVEKMTEYAAFGVPLYWILDPALGTFEVFGLDAEGRYARVAAATEGVVTGLPNCRDLALDLDELWAKLARLCDEE